MSMQLLGYTLEEKIDFYINIGLYSEDDRQNKIDELYKSASEILSVMQPTDESSRR